jgi:hypothetical protein
MGTAESQKKVTMPSFEWATQTLSSLRFDRVPPNQDHFCRGDWEFGLLILGGDYDG